MLAVAAVAVIALHRDDLARDIHHLVGLHERHRPGDGHKCFRLVVGPAQTSADEDVESSHRIIRSPHRDEREVVGVDVDAVVALQRDGRLELSGEVLLAVDGFLLRLR